MKYLKLFLRCLIIPTYVEIFKVVFALFNPSSWELRCWKIWLLHNLFLPPKYKLSLAKALSQKFPSGGARLSTYGGKFFEYYAKLVPAEPQNKKTQSSKE